MIAFLWNGLEALLKVSHLDKIDCVYSAFRQIINFLLRREHSRICCSHFYLLTEAS